MKFICLVHGTTYQNAHRVGLVDSQYVKQTFYEYHPLNIKAKSNINLNNRLMHNVLVQIYFLVLIPNDKELDFGR